MDNELFYNTLALVLSPDKRNRTLGLELLHTFAAAEQWDEERLLTAILDYFSRDLIRLLVAEKYVSLPLESRKLLRELGKIKDLNLSGISVLPKGLALLKHNIQKLIVSYGYSAEFLAYLGDFSVLEELSLAGTGINCLHDDFQRLILLKKLLLNKNQFTELPIQICALPALTFLDISSNPLSSIPNEIENLQKLEVLYCNNTQLRQIPIGLTKLNALRDLRINTLEAHALPPELFALPNLQSLTLSGNNSSIHQKMAIVQRYPQVNIAWG